MKLILILMGSMLVNNFVMNKFYGCCPFLGVSKRVETAFGMGMAVIFVITVASIVTYFVRQLLVALSLEYLQTIAFILVIAVLVQVVETALKKLAPALYRALGVYLPLITTNCAVLGATIMNVDEGYNLLKSSITVLISAVEGEACPDCHRPLLTASATVNDKAVEMKEDNGSVHAAVPFTVINTKGF